MTHRLTSLLSEMARSSIAARMAFGLVNTLGIMTPPGFQLSLTSRVHNGFLYNVYSKSPQISKEILSPV